MKAAGLAAAIFIGLSMMGGNKQQDNPQISGQAVGMGYSEFLDNVSNGKVREVVLQQQQGGILVGGELQDGARFQTIVPPTGDGDLVNHLHKNQVKFQSLPAKQPEKPSMLMSVLINMIPLVVVFGLLMWWKNKQMGANGAGGGAAAFGKSKAKLLMQDANLPTFADVAGVEEAKEDMQELVDFLRNPGKYQRLGGKMPTGTLMVGPPGTGKTLMAKAIAGEAKVPFFSISGSDFVEMFVGVGASRVRDMFKQAKENAPCIIFIDEIDAVGRKRGAGLGGGHDEREQTLNQLLVEMDGFEENAGIIVVAATNRPDVLDPALKRPGRFDRQIVVSNPTLEGREKILQVHMRRVPLADDVNAHVVARGTPGFSGADLANLVNEAALAAARSNHDVVTMGDFEFAKNKILMGPERKSQVMTEEDRRKTAYHEAGHALVGLNTDPPADPLHMVTIVPRGQALGVTMNLPEKDQISITWGELESRLAMMYGGRAAEEIIYGKKGISTGASNDIQRATEIAENMVKKWGFSDDLGPRLYGDEQGEVFLGAQAGRNKGMSEITQQKIDEAVTKHIKAAEQLALDILGKRNRKDLETITEGLMKYETLSGAEVQKLLNGETIDREEVVRDLTHPEKGSGIDHNQPKNDDNQPPPPAGPRGPTGP
ncbi:MAG: ATP-dependent metallopeptidase FtsH/Yme1/Tma family protein [Rhodospirillales bacterium]|nr:ATP-dependent metallopeptidase FtsH/Yme1/Tma family protein [Rhodospirillales bacterium]MCB9995023.1 ATP-dependent metallopeptidase FtsH/Yme1/Tma family protein [Rhodospirillales bacterium]